MLKSITALKALAKKDPFEWPTLKILLRKIKDKFLPRSCHTLFCQMQEVSGTCAES